jgi:hypothetical protein
MVLCGLLSCCWLVTSVQAEDQFGLEAPHRLSHYIPGDIDICVEWSDLSVQKRLIEKTGLWKRLVSWPAFAKWMETTEILVAQNFLQHWEAHTGWTLSETLMGLGSKNGCLVFDINADQRVAVAMVLETETSEFNQKFVSAWNMMDHATITEKQADGFDYQERASSPHEILFYAQRDELLITSNSETMLLDILRLWQKSTTDQLTKPITAKTSLAQTAYYQKSLQVLSSGAALRMIIDPAISSRMIKAYLMDELELQAIIAAECSKLEGIVGLVTFQQGLGLELVILTEYPAPAVKNEQHPPVKDLIQVTSGANTSDAHQFIRYVPQGVMFSYSQLALSKSEDVHQLIVQLLKNMLEREDRDEIVRAQKILQGLAGGQTPQKTLATLGPNLGIAIDLNAERLVPIDVMLGIQLPSAEKDVSKNEEAKAGLESISSAMIFFMNMAYNSALTPTQPSIVHSEIKDGTTQRWIDSIEGWTPGFRLDSHWWMFTSDIGWLNQSREPVASGKGLLQDPFYKQAQQLYFKDSSIQVWCDLVKLRTFMTQHRDYLVHDAGIFGEGARKQKDERFERFRETLELTDAIYVSFSEALDKQSIRCGLLFNPDAPNP